MARILISGGAGHVGRHCAKALVAAGGDRQQRPARRRMPSAGTANGSALEAECVILVGLVLHRPGLECECRRHE
jgi:nucleoside-diphosphate-sugar epimerase